MYEIGRVYIWQNLREHTYLNGTETTVIGAPEWFGFQPDVPLMQYSETDTYLDDGRCLWATLGELKPKFDSAGEKSITDMFKVPQHEPA